MKSDNVNTTGKTILIVDDDMDYLFQLKTMVEQMGFDVVTAENQAGGEQQMEHIKPDLAIFDLMMENDDSGFILSYKMKKKYPEVPVMIATAVTAHTGITFDTATAGERNWIKADVFIAKGIRADQLHREINRLLKI